MGIFDKENEIIEYFQTIVSPPEVALIPENDEMERECFSLFLMKSLGQNGLIHQERTIHRQTFIVTNTV